MTTTTAQNGIVLENLWDTKTGTFSADMLKLTAMITMLIDHIGAGILEQLIIQVPLSTETYEILITIDQVLRLIGRIAFPIYCFLLVQGFLHTKSRLKYAGNLLLFALLSEYPFDFIFSGGLDFSSSNVMFTLLIGLLTMWGIEKAGSNIFFQVLISAVGILTAAFLHTDYSWMGILLILSLYFLRVIRFWQCLFSFILFFLALVFRSAVYYDSIWRSALRQLSSEYTLVFSFWMMYRYNGKRYLKRGKYLFYSFYPVHLLLLGIIFRLILFIIL